MGSLANTAAPGVPTDPKAPGWGEQISTTVNNILVGKLNNNGTVRLNLGGVSTTVSDARVGPNSVINLMPTNTLGAISLNQWGITTRTNGSFTIAHLSTSTSTATAAYVVFG